jgi:hypothetical protein
MTRANRPLLDRISKFGGGREIVNPSEAFRPLVRPGLSITELWPILLLLAALLLPIDVAFRRLALPFSEIWEKILMRIRLNRQPKLAPSEAVVDRLHAAKKRVENKPDSPPVTIDVKPTEPTARAVQPKSDGRSTAQALLEAKRQRDQRKDD